MRVRLGSTMPLPAGRRARGHGAHVGIVKEVSGNSVTLVSGNHNRKVGVGKYPRGRVVAYVWPE